MAYLFSYWLYGRGRLAILLIGLIGATAAAAHELGFHPIGQDGDIHVHELGVAITCASPPYYYLNGNDGGQEWRLIAAAFEKSGHPAAALYLPMLEAVHALGAGWIDAVWTCGDTEIPFQEAIYYSEPLIPRQFVAISLADSGISIDTVADLLDRKVALHPEVKAVIGKPLEDIEHDHGSFQLISNHALLAMMLFTGQIDVLVAEKSTFEYYRRKLPKRVGPETSLVFSPVFPPVYPRLVFTDRTLRDEFNAARNALQAEYASQRLTGQADAIRPSEMIPKQVEPE